MSYPQRGDIYWADLNPSKGSEINKIRPCLIISASPINRARRTVVVIPISSSSRAIPPITIPIFSQDKEAVAVIDQIRAIDKGRLKDHIRTLSISEMLPIEEALREVLNMPQ